MAYEEINAEQWWTCPRHSGPERLVKAGVSCPLCVHECEHGRDPASMTLDEQVAEVQGWVDMILTVPFDKLWHRLDELVGRSTFNHEWGKPEAIIEEMRGQREWDGPIGSLRRVAGPDKPIFVVGIGGEEPPA